MATRKHTKSLGILGAICITAGFFGLIFPPSLPLFAQQAISPLISASPNTISPTPSVGPSGSTFSPSPSVFVCSDGKDNDNDTLIDFGTGATNDPGCANAQDNDETNGSPPPSVGLTGTVKGTVTLRLPKEDGTGDELIPAPSITIYEVVNDEKTEKATTADDGTYTIEKVTATSHKYQAETDGLTSDVKSITVKADPFENKLDFELVFEDVNQVYGTITDDNKEPIASAIVTVSKDGVTIGRDLTDTKGNYLIKDEDLGEGTYNISVREPSHVRTQVVPPDPENPEWVKFQKKRGQKVKHSVSLPKPKTLVTIRVIEGIGDVFIVRPITSITTKVTVHKADQYKENQKGIRNFTAPVSEAEFSPTELNSSVYEFKKEGYKTNVVKLYPGYNEILLEKEKRTDCIKKPKPNVKEFWFCGKEAQAMSTDPKYTSHWSAIDTTIGLIRRTYPEYMTDTGFRVGKPIVREGPQQLFIESSPTHNAGYIRGDAMAIMYGNIITDCPAALSGTTEPKSGERIIFSTEYIKKNTAEEVAHTTTHEMGHLKDVRMMYCVDEVSTKKDSLFNALITHINNTPRYKRLVVPLLKDSKYDLSKPTSGHPDENNNEAYASAYHAWREHKAAFDAKIREHQNKNPKDAQYLDRFGVIFFQRLVGESAVNGYTKTTDKTKRP